jgi:cytochrome c peroxidase
MGQEMLAVELEGQELEDLVEFMHALTGEIPAFPVPALP